MKPMSVEASYEPDWPVNWDHIGTVLVDDDKMPEFIKIDGVIYEKQ